MIIWKAVISIRCNYCWYSFTIGLALLLLLTQCSPISNDVEVVEPVKDIQLASRSMSTTTTTTTTPELVTEKHVFRVTAYCCCEKCCGKWANNRPIDSNGNPIVIGSSGNILIPMVSVASPLPFGTWIELDTIGTVVVHDRTAEWLVKKHGQYIIDLYMNDHQKALEFGVKQLEGVIRSD